MCKLILLLPSPPVFVWENKFIFLSKYAIYTKWNGFIIIVIFKLIK